MGLALASLWPAIPPGIALVAGIVLALTLGNPFGAGTTRRFTHRLLQLSVIGLGGAMNLQAVLRTGLHGLGYTVVGISFALGAGWLLARAFRVPRDAGLLIAIGTAICGGSAVAAAAPVMRAKDHDVSVALAIVFSLNAVALVLFPPLGHLLHLSPQQFGLFSALAIHDTSSVVGAALNYGGNALEVATSVKLARALWIVPLTLGLAAIESRRSGAVEGKPSRPWFILGFIALAAATTWIAPLHAPGEVIAQIAKRTLVLTLFLIGAGLSRETMRQAGVRPLAYGFALWLVVGTATLGALELGWLA